MVTLSSTSEVLTRLAAGSRIVAEAYTVHGPILRALETAARRGAHVAVELEAKPFGNPKLAKENARLAHELRRAGADARLQDRVHAKEIAIDGTLYLDEKNWHAGDVVLRDDDAGDARVAATKSDALAREAQLLAGARARDGVIVESESFGSGNAVYSQLKELGRAGASPRLLVSERVLHGDRRERRVLEALMHDGVRIRVCEDSSKFAAAGDRVWIGSANASYASGKWDMSDWGLCTANAEIVRTVCARLEVEWKTAREFETGAHGSVGTHRSLGGYAVAGRG